MALSLTALSGFSALALDSATDSASRYSVQAEADAATSSAARVWANAPAHALPLTATDKTGANGVVYTAQEVADVDGITTSTANSCTNTDTSSQYDVVFYDVAVTCGSATGWTYSLEVQIPPEGTIPSQCAPSWLCVAAQATYKVPNPFGRILGSAATSTVSTSVTSSCKTSYGGIAGGLTGLNEYTVTAPHNLALGPDGNMWVSEDNNQVAKVAPNGSVLASYTDATSWTQYIAAGPDGNMWGTAWSNRFFSLTMAGVFTQYTVPTATADTNAMAVGPDNNLWMTEWTASKIARSTTAGVVTEYTVPTAGSNPAMMLNGPDGNIWFTEYAGDKVAKMTMGGVFTEYPLSAGANPNGIALGTDGNIWFTEAGHDKIGKMTTAGVLTEYPLSAGANPWDISAGPGNTLWFTEKNANKIGSITTAGVFAESALPVANSEPWGIAQGTNGSTWFAETNDAPAANRVGAITTQCPGVTLTSSVTYTQPRTLTTTFSTTAANDYVLVFFSGYGVLPMNISGGGLTWTNVVNYAIDYQGDTQIWWAKEPSIVSNVPVTMTGTWFGTLYTESFKGVDTTTPIGATQTECGKADAADMSPCGQPSALMPTVTCTTTKNKSLVWSSGWFIAAQLSSAGANQAIVHNHFFGFNTNGWVARTTNAGTGGVGASGTAVTMTVDDGGNGGYNWEDACVEIRAAGATAPTLDSGTFSDTDDPDPTSMTSPAISSTLNNEVFVAFLSLPGPCGPGYNSASTVTGGGLTWHMELADNAGCDDAEIWWATSATPVTNMQVTANYTIADDGGLMYVSAWSGVDTGTPFGAGSNCTDSDSAAPTATVTTSRANSWVWAVGNDWLSATARTVDAGQTLVQQQLDPFNDTYWVQSMNSATPTAGTAVTIDDTAPAGDQYDLCAVAIQPT